VLDVMPKKLNAMQISCMHALQRQVTTIMELKLGHDMLTKSIEDIEQQKDAIEKQNVQFKKIAQIESHELRGPLASVMSLMNLIKYEDYQVNKDYLLLMEEAVNKLDEKICSVVQLASVV
jgi:light-regulated signal transduction histidine kinase (bacteriophytochrome)